MSLVKLAIGLGATGVFLLIFHAVYRLLLACRACCCKKKCCTCVEKNTKGKGTRYRLVMWCLIGGVVVSLCTYTYGQTTLLEGVDALNDAIDKIVALIDNLQDIVKDMTQATAHMSNALASVSCVGGYESEYEDYVDQISEVNATVSDVNANFKDMRKPVDTIQDRVASHGKTYVAAIVPLVVATPFSLYVILTVLGLLAELVHSAATRFCGSCCLNAGACWAGGPGLGLALLVFVVLCVFSIALADFCWLGPASVLTGDNDDNQYLAYFLQCVGENPLESDVNTMSDAVDDLYDATSELSGYTSYPSRRRNTSREKSYVGRRRLRGRSASCGRGRPASESRADSQVLQQPRRRDRFAGRRRRRAPVRRRHDHRRSFGVRLDPAHPGRHLLHGHLRQNRKRHLPRLGHHRGGLALHLRRNSDPAVRDGVDPPGAAR